MEDGYRRAYFDLRAQNPNELTVRERDRILCTAELVPSHWRRIVDVGCGDGRVSRVLIERGHTVVGIDWSSKSLQHFPGETRVCDIRKPWPFSEPFDGAICCEVLEHLMPDEAGQVVAQLRENSTQGILVTVPAHETLEANLVACPSCGEDFHLWGHSQAFESFKAVDRLVGKPATCSRFISLEGEARSSSLFAKWRRRHGFSPYDPSVLCPHCGAHLGKPAQSSLVDRLLNKGISLSNRVTAPFRPRGGWFACRYDA